MGGSENIVLYKLDKTSTIIALRKNVLLGMVCHFLFTVFENCEIQVPCVTTIHLVDEENQ